MCELLALAVDVYYAVDCLFFSSFLFSLFFSSESLGNCRSSRALLSLITAAFNDNLRHLRHMHKAGLCFVLSVLLSYHSSSAFQPLLSRTAAFNNNVRHRGRIELRGGGAPTMAATKPEKIVICGGGIQSAAIAYYLRC
jgi:hypothetical protein